jgi:hypothetical protein
MAIEQHVYDEVMLRARIRELIASGELTGANPLHVWGGPGTGEPCCVCARPIPVTEMEYELALEGSRITLHFHQNCHGLWQLERRKQAPGPGLG